MLFLREDKEWTVVDGPLCRYLDVQPLSGLRNAFIFSLFVPIKEGWGQSCVAGKKTKGTGYSDKKKKERLLIAS